jgi:hypothetical protein
MADTSMSCVLIFLTDSLAFVRPERSFNFVKKYTLTSFGQNQNTPYST